MVDGQLTCANEVATGDAVTDPSPNKTAPTAGALYKRAWDEQVAPRYRAGEPAPGTSRERFLRLLDAAGYLANHIHQAPSGLCRVSKAAIRLARQARRSIQRFRICYWRHGRSASARH